MSGDRAGLRLAVIGLSGVGKSTFGSFVEQLAADKGLQVHRLKLARPLYELQRQVYAAAGRATAADSQDQLLMESLAEHLRRIAPRSLADDFLARLRRLGPVDIVLNDDLRDPHVDASALRDAGFRIVRIHCAEDVRRKRLARRNDLSRADRSTAELDLITADEVVDSGCDLATYRERAGALLGRWL